MKLDIFRKKRYIEERKLLRKVGALELVLMGVGAIIGAGIFVITGMASATMAGPGIVLSFVFGAISLGISAFAYAELSSAIPVSGSAYSYTYSFLGEIIAWLVGWNLVLEYGISTAAVAVGWSSYFRAFLKNSFGILLPHALTGAYNPSGGTYIDIGAFLIILLMFGILILGIKESAFVSSFIVVLKILVLILFIVFALPHIKFSNYKDFLPYGISGVWHATGLIIFAYLGFDAVSTVAEEVKNPKKDLPIGLIGSLSLSTLFYIVVSLVLTGVVNYKELNVPDALSFAMEKLNMHFIASVISIGAVITITSVIMVMGLGFTRVVYALSRDGLLFESLADIHPKFGTPYKATILGAFVLSLAAGLFPLKDLAEMVNIGTLFAYFMVGISIVMIRKSQDYQPKFRIPIAKILLPLNLFTLLLIMAGLPLITWIRFFLWCVVGLLIYIFYGYKHSQLNR